jgi:hypothetical protein
MDILANKMIDALGGTKATAKIMGKSAQAVSKWRINSIPPDCLELIRYRKPKIYKSVMDEMAAMSEGDE